MFGAKGVNTDAEFLAVVKAAGPDDATANTIAALYPDIPAIGIPGTLGGRPQANTPMVTNGNALQPTVVT
jgi:hypothetical protein